MNDDRKEVRAGPAENSSASNDRLLLAGAIFGFLGVALGAFGAHWLSGWLEPASLETFETAVRYQLIHAVALVGLAGIPGLNPALIRWVGRLFVIGIVIFAGSLYALVFSGIGMWGAVTPIGGLCFLAGWAMLAVAAWRSRSVTSS